MPTSDEEQLLDRARELSREANDEEEEARWQVITELQRIGGEVTFSRCREWATSTLGFERELAAHILGQLAVADDYPFKARSVPILGSLLDDSETSVVESALIALGHLRITECLDRVIALRTHPDAEMRYAVVFALLTHKVAKCVNALIELSRDSEPKVRDWATFGLGSQIELDTPEIRGALFARARDSDPDTRAEAITGLVNRRDARAVDALLEALSTDTVGTLEVEAAKNIGAPELASRLESLQSWWDVDIALLRDAILSCGGTPAE